MWQTTHKHKLTEVSVFGAKDSRLPQCQIQNGFICGTRVNIGKPAPHRVRNDRGSDAQYLYADRGRWFVVREKRCIAAGCFGTTWKGLDRGRSLDGRSVICHSSSLGSGGRVSQSTWAVRVAVLRGPWHPNLSERAYFADPLSATRFHRSPPSASLSHDTLNTNRRLPA